ncbi:MAG: YggT family protein [Spirochaetaceae bacterium]|jgi:YggT family protein|nr:YggT family protein [Spirochaetaceae bacterium]
MLQQIFFFLSRILALYSFVIFIRIILSWFSGIRLGFFYDYLCKITDPYLLWFRRFRVLTPGVVDLSPIAALAVLNILGNIFVHIASTGTITAGFLFALLLSIVWSALSFVLGFIGIVLFLRLIAYCISADIYAPFWSIIDHISRPVLYRVSRIFFHHRIVHYLATIIISIIGIIGIFCTLAFFVKHAAAFLLNLPF